MTCFFLVALLSVAAVQASPTPVRGQNVTAMTTEQVNSFSPYTHYAGAAYCAPQEVHTWKCGAHCDANKGFQLVANGGNGSSVQYWYVGYDSNLKTVIAAHQGTNNQKIQPLLTDAHATKTYLNQSLFPQISNDIEVHSGFQKEHAKTASDILTNVQSALSKYKANSVTLVGHSLGGAIALLDSVYLPLHLPNGTTYRTVLYGLPRVGNQAFANYVDAHTKLTHINNNQDPVPITPPKTLGYVQPSGEVHITGNKWMQCPGQDNSSKDCSAGAVKGLSHLGDHNGPYNGIKTTCSGK